MKAIAFDLGRVLFDFDYNIALDKIRDKINILPQEIINALFYEHFSDDFEKGLITGYDFYLKFKKRTGLRLEYENFLPVWCDIFTLKPQSINLVKSLKPFYKLILISNINELHYNFLKERYPSVFELFDEKILSFKVHSIKPESDIYRLMLEKAKVCKEELVYIDDRPDLIQKAKERGYNCILFKELEECKYQLKRLGVFLPSKDEVSLFTELSSFLSKASSGILGPGNLRNRDDNLAMKLISLLKDGLRLKVFDSGFTPENISFRRFKEMDRLLVIDTCKFLRQDFRLSGLEEVFSLKPFSTHTSLYLELLKKELKLEILFLLIKEEDFQPGKSFSSQIQRRLEILTRFFLRNFSKEEEEDGMEIRL